MIRAALGYLSKQVQLIRVPLVALLRIDGVGNDLQIPRHRETTYVRVLEGNDVVEHVRFAGENGHHFRPIAQEFYLFLVGPRKRGERAGNYVALPRVPLKPRTDVAPENLLPQVLRKVSRNAHLSLTPEGK